MSNRLQSRHKRIDQQTKAVTTAAKDLDALLRSSGHVQDGHPLRIWTQMTACCKSLGLSPHHAPHELVHVSRMAGRALSLTSTLAPVGGAAQPSPRPQDVALVESLLQSQLLRVLTSTLQRLMPKHIAGAKGTCSCCRADAETWSRTVHFKGPKHPRVSVGSAVSTLMHRHLDLLVRVNAWLESVAAAAPAAAPAAHGGSSSSSSSNNNSSGSEASPDAAAGLWQRVQRLHVDFAAQIITCDDLPTGAAALHDAVSLHQLRLAQSASDPEDVSPDHSAASNVYQARPCLGTALPRLPPVDQYKHLVALHGVLHTSAARAATGLMGPAGSQLCACLCQAVIDTSQSAMVTVLHAAQSGLALDVSPAAGLPPPITLLTYCVRDSSWWWKRAAPSKQSPYYDALVHLQANMAFQLLFLSGAASPEQALGHGSSTSRIMHPTGADPCVAMAALDCLAALLPHDGKGEIKAALAVDGMQSAYGWMFKLAGAGGSVTPGSAGPESAALSLGAGRASAPRCAVSAAAVAVGASVSTFFSTHGVAHTDFTSRQYLSAAAAYGSTVRIVLPTLRAVLAPLAAALRAPGTDLSGVLASTPSKPDIACCLSAAWTCLTSLGAAYQVRPDASRDTGPVVQLWAPLLTDCQAIMSGLCTWFEEGPAASWVPAKDAWRAALQEYGVVRVLCKVFPGMFFAQIRPAANATSAQCAISDVVWESMEPARTALLSTRLLRHLTGLASPGVGAGSEDMPQACCASHGEYLLPCRARDECEACGQAVLQVLFFTVRRTTEPLPEPATMPSFLADGAPQLLTDPFSSSAAAARLRWPEAARQLMALLDCVQWRDTLLQATEHLTLSCGAASMPLLPAAHNQILSQLSTLAEWVPVRLAQWVEAAAPSAPGASRLSDWMLPDLQAALEGSAADVHAVVARVTAHQQDSNTCTSPADSAAKQGAAQKAKLEKSAAEQAGAGVDGCALATHISSAPFCGLWGWSSAACARLVGELRTACAAGGPLQAPGQPCAVDAGSAVAVMQAAVHAAAAVDAAAAAGGEGQHAAGEASSSGAGSAQGVAPPAAAPEPMPAAQSDMGMKEAKEALQCLAASFINLANAISGAASSSKGNAGKQGTGGSGSAKGKAKGNKKR